MRLMQPLQQLPESAPHGVWRDMDGGLIRSHVPLSIEVACTFCDSVKLIYFQSGTIFLTSSSQIAVFY